MVLYEFNTRHAGAVTLARLREFGNTQIASLPLGVLRSVIAEQFLYDLFVADTARNKAAIGDGRILGECDEALHAGANRFRAGLRRFDLAGADQIIAEIAHKRDARAAEPAEFLIVFLSFFHSNRSTFLFFLFLCRLLFGFAAFRLWRIELLYLNDAYFLEVVLKDLRRFVQRG